MDGRERTRTMLLGSLFLIALAAFLLHFRIHPFLAPEKDNPAILAFKPSFIPATVLPLVDLVLVTLLFASRRTAVYGYLLNGLIVIYGSVLMAHFSIAGLAPKNPALFDWILKSTFPDIALAWGDFLVGAALYRSWVEEHRDG